jgi:hypothetical protein
MSIATPDFARLKSGPESELDSEAGQTALAAQLESLWTEYNTATDGTNQRRGRIFGRARDSRGKHDLGDFNRGTTWINNLSN